VDHAQVTVVDNPNALDLAFEIPTRIELKKVSFSYQAE